MICVVTWILIGLQMWVVCCNGLLCRTSRGKSLLHTGYKLVVSVSRQPQVQPHAIKPNPRKPDAKAEHAHAQWPWLCCDNTQGKHGPTPPTSHGRTAPRPISGDLGAQQGGQVKKVTSAHIPHH